MYKISLGADHAGFPLKEALKKHLELKEITYIDCGTFSEESCDYAVSAKKACEKVIAGEAEFALLCCGTGVGISIAANKIGGIRAAAVSDYFSAKYTRLHNDANVLCPGSRVVGAGLASELLDIFLNTEFEGGERHIRRVAQIAELDKGDIL